MARLLCKRKNRKIQTIPIERKKDRSINLSTMLMPEEKGYMWALPLFFSKSTRLGNFQNDVYLGCSYCILNKHNKIEKKKTKKVCKIWRKREITKITDIVFHFITSLTVSMVERVIARSFLTTDTHTYIQTYLCTHVRICICVYIYSYVYACKNVGVYIYTLSSHSPYKR